VEEQDSARACLGHRQVLACHGMGWSQTSTAMRSGLAICDVQHSATSRYDSPANPQEGRCPDCKSGLERQ